MHKYAFALLAVTIPILPLSLRACDCGCHDLPVVIHFKDGIAPNGPVTAAPRQAVSVEGGCPGSALFGFRDYGPAHVTPPPAEPPVKRPLVLTRGSATGPSLKGQGSLHF